MNGKRALILALVVLFFGQLIYYYLQLPERIASHFGASGEADEWMSKNAFYAFEIGLLAFILILFYYISYFISRMPCALVNLPNKDYWLAPERQDETVRFLRGKMETFQIPLLALFISINQLAIRANLNRENLSPASWLVLGAFLLYTVVRCFGLNKKFKIYENRTS